MSEMLGLNPSKKAQKILDSIHVTMKLREKIGGLPLEEDQIRRYILEEFPKLNRAPTVKEIEKAFDTTQEDVMKILEKLNERDIIYMKDGKILGAYPFSSVPTDHVVTLKRDGKAYAMCAIDALGVPFMFGQDVLVESCCADCGEEIKVEIKDGRIVKQNPSEIVVWVGLKCSEHAATSLCTTLIFLCSEDHLKGWRAKNPGQEGEALSLPEALYVGKGVFEDFLR